MTRCRRIVHISTQLDILSSTHVPKIGRGGGRGEEHHLVESSKSTARRLYLNILPANASRWIVGSLKTLPPWLARGEHAKEIASTRKLPFHHRMNATSDLGLDHGQPRPGAHVVPAGRAPVDVHRDRHRRQPDSRDDRGHRDLAAGGRHDLGEAERRDHGAGGRAADALGSGGPAGAAGAPERGADGRRFPR